MDRDIRKVLIIRTDGVGGLLLSTPVIRNIREAFPSASVTLLADARNAHVLNGWERLDDIREYDPNWPRSDKRRLARNLRDERYDMCMVLSAHCDSYGLAGATRAPIRAGVVYSGCIVPRVTTLCRLTHRTVLHIERAAARRRYVPHEVEQGLQLLRLLGLPAHEYPLEVPLRRMDLSWAGDMIARNCSARALVGVHLSRKWLSSGWSGLGLALLFDELQQTVPDCGIVATYGPDDQEVADQVRPYLECGDPIGLGGCLAGRVLLAGNLTFGQWAGLTALCDVVLSRDTASLHLASALGCPVVAVYDKDHYHRNCQQWAPWKVPYFRMESGYLSESSPGIVRRIAALLSMPIERAA